MALVVLGSRRVTRDFDLLIACPGEALVALVDALYDRGFELASRVSAEGEVTATIGSRPVAAARLRLDARGDPRATTGLGVEQVECVVDREPKTRGRWTEAPGNEEPGVSAGPRKRLFLGDLCMVEGARFELATFGL